MEEEQLINVTGKEFQIVGRQKKDTELLNISSTKIRSWRNGCPIFFCLSFFI